MSSYIVDDETICRFLSIINKVKSNEFNTKIGRRLLKMNIDATEQRYINNPYLNKKDKKIRLNKFGFKLILTTKIQALKSLQCFLYQCSEGNIPNRKLYKEMRIEEKELMYYIINDLKEYQDAKWG